MGVAINFVIYPQSSISEVGIRSCIFHAVGPGTRVSHICVAQYSPDHNALTCKSYNRVKSRVSKKNPSGSRNHVKFSAFENLLSARLRISILLLGYTSQLGHKSLYELLSLARLGSRNGLLPGSFGRRTTLSHLETSLELSVRIPCGI